MTAYLTVLISRCICIFISNIYAIYRLRLNYGKADIRQGISNLGAGRLSPKNLITDDRNQDFSSIEDPDALAQTLPRRSHLFSGDNLALKAEQNSFKMRIRLCLLAVPLMQITGMIQLMDKVDFPF